MMTKVKNKLIIGAISALGFLSQASQGMDHETQNHLTSSPLMVLETGELRDNILSSLTDKDKNNILTTCSFFLPASEKLYEKKYKEFQMMDFGLSPKQNYGVNRRFATYLALMHNLADGDGCEIEHQKAEAICQMIMGLETTGTTVLIKEFIELLKNNLKNKNYNIFENPLAIYIKKDFENKLTSISLKLLTIMGEKNNNFPNLKCLYFYFIDFVSFEEYKYGVYNGDVKKTPEYMDDNSFLMKAVKNVRVAHDDRCLPSDKGWGGQINYYDKMLGEKIPRINGKWDQIFSIDPGTTCTDHIKAIKTYGKAKDFSMTRRYIDLCLKTPHPMDKELKQQLDTLHEQDKNEAAFVLFMGGVEIAEVEEPKQWHIPNFKPFDHYIPFAQRII